MFGISLGVHINGDDCWPDLAEKGFIAGSFVAIARLSKGTVSGKSSVTVRIELPDGRTVLAETSLALLRQAVAAFNAAEAQEQGGTQ